MAGKTAILAIKILGDAKDAQKALDDTSSSAGKMSDGIGKAAVPAAAALAGLAAAGFSAAEAAAEDQASQAQLALALKNATGASDAQVASTEAWISSTSKAAAVADDELRPALGTLVRSTGDVEESQKAMGIALDVSAATGKDLGSTTDALAKAYAGNTASLGKLVPGLDKATLASGDMDAIMAELARTTGGAAAEAAGTAAGQMAGMKIQMDEAKESIGAALLPALSALAGMLATAAMWIQDNSTLFLVLGGIIGVTAAGILALNVAIKAYTVVSKAIQIATKAWSIVQIALNVALTANPIGIIIVAIGALIGIIVLIATKTTWFQDIWNTVWNAIQGPINAVKKIINTVSDAISDLINWLGKIKLPKVLTDIGSAIGGIFKAGGKSVGTVATVGVAPTLSAAAASASSSRGGVTVVVQGALDPVAVARQIRQILRNDERRQGGVVIA